MPEAALAREVGLEYATIAVVANFAAGRGDSLHSVRMEDIEQVLQQSLVRVRRIIEQLVAA
jgi:5'-methylthioinosine phosphorylase